MSFLKRIAAAPPRLGTVFVAIAAIYLFTAPVEFLTTDGAIRELVAKNLLDHGDVALLQIEEGEMYNRRLWTTGRDGRPYTHFGIGQSLLEIPFLLIYRLARVTGLMAHISYGGTLPMIGLMVVSAALTCALLFGIIRRLGYSPVAALRVAALAAFATALWGLSRQNFDMVQEALGVVGALYFSCRFFTPTPALPRSTGEGGRRPGGDDRWSLQQGRLKLAAAGLCYGMAIVTRISAIVAAPALAWMLLGSSEWGTWRERVRALAWFIVGVVAVGWIIPVYNFVRFANPFLFGYENHPPYPGGPLIDGLLRWLVSPWQGALVYTPFLLALLMVWRRFAREHPHLLSVIVVLFLSYLLFYAQFTGLGLFGWGPYYILPGLLPLALPFAEFFEHWRTFPRWQRGIACFLIALSVTVQLTSISVPTERYQTAGVLREEPGSGNVLYDLTWTPIRLQAEATIQNLAHLPDYARYLDTPPDFEPQTLMDEFFAYNLPDWWWLFQVLKGGESGLAVPVAAGLSIAWLVTRRLPRDAGIIQPEGKQVPEPDRPQDPLHLQEDQSVRQSMVWDDIWHQKRYVSDYTLRFYAYLDSLAQSLHRDAAILECGCGPGGGLTRFAMNGLCAYGIDLSTTAVMNARAQGSNVVRANILAMPFPSGSFDLVYNSGVIEHFDKPEIALAEMARVTKPGGKVLVIVPNKFCPQYQLYKFITMKLGTWPFGYEESYSLGRLKRLYANANLTIDRVVAFQVLPPLATHDWELLPLSIRRRLMGLERLFPFRVYYAYAIGILGAKRQKASQSCNVGA